MGKLETAVKTEINRLAKKQGRALTTKLKEDLKQVKGRVRDLDKQVKGLKKQLESEQLKRKVKKVTAKAADQEQVRLSPKLIKALRKRLGISQADLAVLAEVSLGAVSQWETGKVSPSAEKKAKIAGLRKLGKREVQRILASKKKPEKKTVKKKTAKKKKSKKAAKPAKKKKTAKKKSVKAENSSQK